jgi:hypothetical protein
MPGTQIHLTMSHPRRFTIGWKRGLLSVHLAIAFILVQPTTTAAGLTIEERVSAQRAVELVYWRHRSWPAQNQALKPQLSAVLSDDAIRAKVEDYLRKSNALALDWQRPVTSKELQAELDRMSRHTRDAPMLRELYAALHDDPLLIAETLARQTLVDRRIRDFYARDGGSDARTLHGTKRSFDSWWAERAPRLSWDIQSDLGSMSLPLPVDSGCAEDAWQLRFYRPDQRKSHTAVWTGSEMIVWGGAQGSDDYLHTGGRYTPATDSWAPTSQGLNVPLARAQHTAVWTGSEMIVWGGFGYGLHGTGGRYNPSTDTWTPTSNGPNVPEPRLNHTAVWTGSEMIIWGGGEGTPVGNSGGRYDPSTDTWKATSLLNAPAARRNHSAVWTGQRMIVWGGGKNSANMDTGGLYDPLSDTWTPTSTGPNHPSARLEHTAIWTGSRMIVWGGFAATYENTGGSYDPTTDTWTTTSVGAGVPSPRRRHSVVWTGSKMIVWGGTSGPQLNTGGGYDPSSNTWAATPISSATPSGRSTHTAIWTGSEMIVWGGQSNVELDTGGRYSPSSDSWTAVSIGDPNAPPAKNGMTSVWTGTEMIVWGGGDIVGWKYTPAIDQWTAISAGSNVPSARKGHTAVWTGAAMIVWGGEAAPYLNSGGRYDPTTDTWSATSLASAPAARSAHTAVWTGTEMIVWGGINSSSLLQTGGRYSPSTDAWIATSTGTNTPSARSGHTAVWTGTEMIIWGGGFDNSGARYVPSTDSWSPTSTAGLSVPKGHSGHTAVWTGTEMIVWGGVHGVAIWNTGGRYTPSSNSWLPMSKGVNVPTPRFTHTAVWTGTEMIVWGGSGSFSSGSFVNTGGRYDPSTDTWDPTATADKTPSKRMTHVAAWTGSQMIVWSGIPLSTELGLYCVACSTPTTVYADTDGDGFGNPAVSIEDCATHPGFVSNSDDCDDAHDGVHPGAAELCDGLDNDCDLTVDNALPPSSTPWVTVSRPLPGTARLGWTYVPNDHTGFDVVHGSLTALTSSAGNFALATQSCMANNIAAPPVDDIDDLDPGEARWFLLRATNCAGNGTYGAEAQSVGVRDAGIAASGNDCP